MLAYLFRSSLRPIFFLVLLTAQAFFGNALDAKTLFEFSGRSDQRPKYGFDDTEAFNASSGFGSFTYRSVGSDSDPNPQVGVYEVVVENFQLDFAGDRIEIEEVSAIATVKDNYGCDCFFIDMEFPGVLAGQPFDRLHIDIQDEFFSESFTMFTNDSLPLDNLNIPPETSTALLLYLGSDLTIFNIDQDSIEVSLLPVPEPSSFLILLVVSVASSIVTPYRQIRS